MIQVNDITYSSGSKAILRPITMSLTRPEMVVILGPNGAGKSSLLQILAGLNKPTTGKIQYNQIVLADWEISKLAKQRAYLHQQSNVFGAFSVEEILEMGRYPYFDMKPTAKDKILVEEMIVTMGLQSRRKQVYQTLSGGEQQRIQFSRAILQLQDTEIDAMNNKVLFLDEPLNNLDLHYQYALMGQARTAVVEKGGIVVAVLHDINMAYQFADRIIILKEGNLVVDDVTENALRPEILSSIFDVEVNKVEVSSQETYFLTRPKPVSNRTEDTHNLNRIEK